MATGSLDAYGIYQYGEDDPASPFSTLLNKLAGSVSTALRTYRPRNASSPEALATLISAWQGETVTVSGAADAYSWSAISTSQGWIPAGRIVCSTTYRNRIAAAVALSGSRYSAAPGLWGVYNLTTAGPQTLVAGSWVAW